MEDDGYTNHIYGLKPLYRKREIIMYLGPNYKDNNNVIDVKLFLNK